MSDPTLHAITQNPDDFAVQIADSIESFIVATTEVAKGDEPDSAVPFLLLELSQLLLAGGRLGAHEDIVPDERYETDTGPEPDVDDLRERFAVLLEPVDVFSEVFDPYEPRKAPVPARISDNLADIVTDLRHGLAHYRVEAEPARRCGGGSSRTSPTGAPRPRPPSAPSSPSSPTSASTSRSRPSTASTRTRT